MDRAKQAPTFRNAWSGGPRLGQHLGPFLTHRLPTQKRKTAACGWATASPPHSQAPTTGSAVLEAASHQPDKPGYWPKGPQCPLRSLADFVRIIGLTGSIDLGRRFSRYVAATLGVVATQEPVGAALPMRQWARPLKISTNKPRSKNCRSRQAVLILALFFSVRVQCYCTRLLRLSHKRDGDGVACVHPSQTRCPCAADRSPCAIATHWRRDCDHRLFAISRSRRHLQIIGARGSEILPCIGMEEIREHKLFAICRSERHLHIIGAGGS